MIDMEVPPVFQLLGWVVMIGLASARSWRLVALDTITDKLRWWLSDKAPRVEEFLTCQWCSGTWIALLLTSLVATLGAWPPLAWLVAIPASALITGYIADRT